jgi:mannitol/fructose-specific phosphotransferase system IIA component (Ntr-type)
LAHTLREVYIFWQHLGSDSHEYDERLLLCLQFNEHFLKKIPPGAEASNIMIGELECLEDTLVAFIRLQKAVLFADLTEVSVPTRFIFIMLGPVGQQQKYHEIGRSMATLMSDEVKLLMFCIHTC